MACLRKQEHPNEMKWLQMIRVKALLMVKGWFEINDVNFHKMLESILVYFVRQFISLVAFFSACALDEMCI